MADGLEIFNTVLSFVVDILSGLSIAGALLTIITFTIFKDLRTYPIKLIIYLCFCIFLAQLWFLLSFYIYDTFMYILSLSQSTSSEHVL
jgi:hypothetical protein